MIKRRREYAMGEPRVFISKLPAKLRWTAERRRRDERNPYWTFDNLGLKHMLMYSFNWRYTPEGHAFWQKINRGYPVELPETVGKRPRFLYIKNK